jgi:hypothetical protein
MEFLIIKIPGFIFGAIALALIVFEYYSRDLLMSLTARHSWVEPDLKSLFHSLAG